MQVKRLISRFIDIIFIFTAFVLTNLTAFSVTVRFPDLSDSYVYACVAMIASLLALLFVQIDLLALWSDFKNIWKKQLPLIIFIVFCIASLLWSVYFNASLFQLSLMIFASLIGVYLAIRYKPGTVFEIVRYFGVFSVVTSFLLFILVPPLARLDNPVFQGAWRGIFWHRNHLGSLMAFFSAIFLVKAMITSHLRVQLFINAVFFILSALLVFGSRSATGILIFLFLSGMLFFVFLWLRIRHVLKKKHYIILLIILGIIAIILITNLDFFFGLLGRNTSLTGRIPLWNDLIKNIWTQRPILGYGFGALWKQESFRIFMQMKLGWTYPVYFSDNGYLDLLLNIGVVGLCSFVMFFLITGVRSFKAFVKNPNPISLFPLLIFVYVLVANISYSFLVEIDQFVWMLLVIAATLSIRMVGIDKIPNNKTNNPQP